MIVTTLGLLLLCGQVAADDSGEMEGAVEEGRFAFVSFTPDGSLTLTFNTTSLQYAIMAGFTGLIIASIILPLLGLFSIASRSDPHYGYAYTDPSGYTQSAYDTTASQALYSKRSKSWMSSVMESLARSLEKYEELNNDISDD